MMVYEDGLLELCGGLFLILAGAMFAVNPGLIGIFVPLLYLVLQSAKTAITKPRLDPAALPEDTAKQRLVGISVTMRFVQDHPKLAASS